MVFSYGIYLTDAVECLRALIERQSTEVVVCLPSESCATYEHSKPRLRRRSTRERERILSQLHAAVVLRVVYSKLASTVV